MGVGHCLGQLGQLEISNYTNMPQHREVDPKNLGVSPEDEAIQDFVDQAIQPSPDDEEPTKKKPGDTSDETDDKED